MSDKPLSQQLAERSFLDLWQGYCTEKEKRQDAEARLAEAEREIERLRELGSRSYKTLVEVSAERDALRATAVGESKCACPYCGCGATDSADPVIRAQHDETGRMWTGPRSQLPRRYFECSAPAVRVCPPKVECEWHACETPEACAELSVCLYAQGRDENSKT